MLANFTKKLESYLNTDEELQRRLAGFETFSGAPDGHYYRAREQGASAAARAVKCYPFGGESHLKDGEVVGIDVSDGEGKKKLVVSLNKKKFSIKNSDWEKPHLTIELSKELFKKTILGRYRWLWVVGMDEVKVGHVKGLPHSDWVTILEILVVMQETVEFDPKLFEEIESL